MTSTNQPPNSPSSPETATPPSLQRHGNVAPASDMDNILPVGSQSKQRFSAQPPQQAFREQSVPRFPRADRIAPAPLQHAREARPVADQKTTDDTQRVYVWDIVVRTTHWFIVLAFIVLAVTGYFIGSPLSSSSGPATEHHLMAWMRALHLYGSVVFSLAVLARVWWMFVGSPPARWSQFVPTTRARLRDMWGTFLFYVFVRPKPPPATGHNALAGGFYLIVFALYFVMIATGFALYSQNAHVDSPMRFFAPLLVVFDGLQSARWLHHVVMWLLILFIIQHIYSAVLMSRVEKTGIVDSIVSGYKFLPRSAIDSSEQPTPRRFYIRSLRQRISRFIHRTKSAEKPHQQPTVRPPVL